MLSHLFETEGDQIGYLYDSGDKLIEYRAKKKPEILNLPNYNAFGKLPALLDADAFALAQASQRLNAALSPTNSILIGSNTLRENDDGAQLKKVQSIIQDWDTKTPPVLGRDTVVRKR
ncbi:hypothetical protein SERLA73DRAFT_160839 [Serpula lacrymans var. lacrymans S7.3]|uniref:Uncharacterized protein n=1 Tax=Serpula lacrymans var. lacrymans (strain S7.3) TaxID=936435 RepID=F8PXH4_SERL3|nr:hypothetical protein SERLA73DRAFT_160839 [Serpula lacrymans var. lacrymans S7.3]